MTDEKYRLETAAKIESPYLLAYEAVEYLRLPSIKSLYSLVERGKLTPLPGHRSYRFTREQLDAFLGGK